MRARIRLFTLMLIRIQIKILLLIKVIRICILSLDATIVSVHGPLQLLNNADPDPQPWTCSF
jgi:hypothetical protein